MAKQAVKIQKGEVVDYTAIGAISNGDVITLTDRVGIACNNAVAGDVISLELEGVYEIEAESGDTIDFGTILYWNPNDKLITTSADDGNGNNYVEVGMATTAKAQDVAGTVLVKIDK